MEKLKVEYVPVESLIPYVNNARKHSGFQVDQIAASIKEFGFVNPVLTDGKNGIMAGHGRVLAAKKLKIKMAPVIELGHLSEPQKKAYILADNRIAENSSWDQEILNIELEALKISEFDISLTGFDWNEPPKNGLIDDDAVPDAKETVCKPGDLWFLGRHKLLCGDSSNIKHVERLMESEKASCIFTDPPYRVAIGDKNKALNNVEKARRILENIVGDDNSPQELKEALLPAFSLIKTVVMAENCTLFVCAPPGGDLGFLMLEMMKDSALPVRHILIWKKNSPTFSIGRLDYDYQHEPIFLTWGKKHKRPMRGSHHTSVWDVKRTAKCDKHPTMKPVELYENAYLNNSDPDDVVFDGFAGSGTAFIASEKVGRVCRGMEIDPKYCDVIVKRWEEFTGKKAELSGNS